MKSALWTGKLWHWGHHGRWPVLLLAGDFAQLNPPKRLGGSTQFSVMARRFSKETARPSTLLREVRLGALSLMQATGDQCG